MGICFFQFFFAAFCYFSAIPTRAIKHVPLNTLFPKSLRSDFACQRLKVTLRASCPQKSQKSSCHPKPSPTKPPFPFFPLFCFISRRASACSMFFSTFLGGLHIFCFFPVFCSMSRIFYEEAWGPGHLRPVILKPVGRIFEISD